MSLLKRLQIIDEKGKVHALFLSHYLFLLAPCFALQSMALIFLPIVSLILIFLKDILVPKDERELEQLKTMIAEVESDISVLKMQQGVKTLR